MAGALCQRPSQAGDAASPERPSATAGDKHSKGRNGSQGEPLPPDELAPSAGEDNSSADEETPTSGDQGWRDVRGQRRPTLPNAKMSPFDVHFSQMRIREIFRCGRSVADSVEQIRAERLEDGGEPVWQLLPPFPPIEVIRWRCKLRDDKGRPKVDSGTGCEIYDDQDRWFTLDNRRLFCLQKAAASFWPERVVVDILELPPGPVVRSRELRKFRTLDSGRSIYFVGSREGAPGDENASRWSWRIAVGIQEPEAAAGVSSEQVGVRKRRPQRLAHRRREDVRSWKLGDMLARLSSTPLGSALTFCVVYSLVRLTVKFAAHQEFDMMASMIQLRDWGENHDDVSNNSATTGDAAATLALSGAREAVTTLCVLVLAGFAGVVGGRLRHGRWERQ